YKENNETKKLLDGVGGLYSWYYSLVENINKEGTDPELEALVAELIKGKTSDLEKVKALYYWTQKNIKYIAFEYALGGFIPREANDVFQKKYGDCKDNSSILYKMLEIAGLEGNLTWIGTRKIPYTYEEVPTPAVDNHMILSYEYNNKTYYLDATGRYIQIDYPSSFIQGKEALIANGKSYKIKKIPVIAANLNTITDSTYLKISGRDIIGSSQTKLSGYLKNNLFYNLENTRKEAAVKELYNKRFSKGSNKFLITSFTEENKFSYEEDFLVRYNFTIQDYVQNIGSEIFINPHINNNIAGIKTKKDRKYAIEFDYKKQYSYTNTIEIPEGYTVSYIPTSVSLGTELLSVNLSYSKVNNTLVCQQDVVFNFINLSVAAQQKVNAIIEQTEKAFKEVIVLQKK
ncbi:transglutaminase-like domain-containing protein, partial [Flavobacteriaceae bacterium]|nr:transglutaminase-like domain-containing protein [Flavobacteriaceae bacterium]